MTNNSIYHKNYTEFDESHQLVLPLNLEGLLPDDDSVQLLAQYETGTRKPKAELTAALAQALDVSPHALDVPDIDSYIGLMHTLFTLEDFMV